VIDADADRARNDPRSSNVLLAGLPHHANRWERSEHVLERPRHVTVTLSSQWKTGHGPGRSSASRVGDREQSVRFDGHASSHARPSSWDPVLRKRRMEPAYPVCGDHVNVSSVLNFEANFVILLLDEYLMNAGRSRFVQFDLFFEATTKNKSRRSIGLYIVRPVPGRACIVSAVCGVSCLVSWLLLNDVWLPVKTYLYIMCNLSNEKLKQRR